MKILFDYQVFYLQKYGGISNYFYHLSLGLRKNYDSVKIFSPVFKNNYGRQLLEKKIIMGRYLKNYPKFTGKLINAINYKSTDYFLKIYNPDIFHMTYYNNNYKFSKKIIKFLTVYDLIHEKFENYYSKSFIELTLKKKKDAIDKADHIICISENTKQDLLNYYNINKNKVSTVHLGVAQKKERPALVETERKFILYVGDRNRYKNFKNLLKAYSNSKLLYENFKLICFGGGPFNHNEKKEIKSLKLSDRNIFQISGNDEVLFSYYTSAECLVIPSLYEGFGLPLIEAMSLNCPVLCSRTSSLVEIGADAAIFFDPYSVEDLQYKIEKFMLDGDKKKIIEKGKYNAGLYTWDNCVNKTLKLYKEKLNYND
ncbi:glycosyltransferase family 4 protein [Candidatus Pelagibacter sp.]|jgi:glycosyltransferase involved in cell wall biosynthesis|nr:glycosyltransferase family 4 protein [Candidatus Pelagibacter sp.]